MNRKYMILLLCLLLSCNTLAKPIKTTPDEVKLYSLKTCLAINYSKRMEKSIRDDSYRQTGVYIDWDSRGKLASLRRFIFENTWYYYKSYDFEIKFDTSSQILENCVEFWQSETLDRYINEYIFGD